MEAMTSEREAFEKWARGEGYAIAKQDDDSYHGIGIRNAWEGWQARAHLAQPAQAVDDERQWREMLAIRVAGPMLYTDDGELSDATAEPYIDFKRDSADTIARKLAERTRALSGEKAGPVGNWQPRVYSREEVEACAKRMKFYDHQIAASILTEYAQRLPVSPTPDKEGES